MPLMNLAFVRGRLYLLALSVLLFSLTSKKSHADDARDFMLSCAYGTLAGTLVGAATLAFTDRPGDNLNKVARGASLGLYAGILLGVYLVYVLPGQDDEEELYQNSAFQNRFLIVPEFETEPNISGKILGARFTLEAYRF